MERIWQHAFYDTMGVDLEGHPVVLTQPIMTPKADCAKTQEIMFETFNAPALCQLEQGLAAIYSCGTTTGIAVDSCGG